MKENPMKEANEPLAIALSRLPIFDPDQRLWGYELVAVSPGGELDAHKGGTDAVPVTLASSTYINLQKVLDRGRMIVVHFSEKSILEALPYALPPGRAVIKVVGKASVDAAIISSLKQLKQDGYLIMVQVAPKAVDKALCELADYVYLPVSGMNRKDFDAFCEKTAAANVERIAADVRDSLVFNECRKAGFRLFQGRFFKQPEIIRVEKLSSTEMSRLQLFKIIEQEDPDFSELAQVISADVSISFRLLSYINSAAFGLRQKVQSIRDAINLLGWQKIKHWLRVVVLSDVSRNQNAEELVALSAQRGKFLEQLISDHDFWGFNPDSLFLLGMFSLLDAMLGRPMDEIVSYLPLEAPIKNTLCRKSNSELLPFLVLAEQLEEAQWENADQMIHQLGLDPIKVRSAFQNAVDWAGEMAGFTAGE